MNTADADSGGRRLPGVRVLVTDDSLINLELAQGILEDEGAEVTLATDGAQAIARLQARPDAFDVVLMDVEMPLLDGLEATRRIRAELGLRDLPILALTSGALRSERQRALDAGMDAFVSKPFDAADLVRLIRQQVERRRGEGLPAASRLARPEAPDPWPLIEGIARDEARQRLMGDVALFAHLLQRLLDEFSAPPAAPAAAAWLHKLGGNAGLLGARALCDAARRGEARARAGAGCAEDVAEVGRLIAALAAQAGPWLEQRARAEPPAAAPTAPLDAGALGRLRRALQTQDLAALDLFEQLTPALRATVDAPRFKALRDAVSRLDFAAALSALPDAGAGA